MAEKNLREQEVNYQLTYRMNYLKNKTEQSTKRLNALMDRLKFMTNNLEKQLQT